MIIDTNILIYYLQNEKNVVDLLEEWQRNNLSLFISVISLSEVLSYSKLTEKDIVVIKKFLDKFVKVQVDERIADFAGALRRKYNIEIGDALIAATAILYNQPLITRNEKDFKKIKELFLQIL